MEETDLGSMYLVEMYLDVMHRDDFDDQETPLVFHRPLSLDEKKGLSRNLPLLYKSLQPFLDKIAFQAKLDPSEWRTMKRIYSLINRTENLLRDN